MAILASSQAALTLAAPPAAQTHLSKTAPSTEENLRFKTGDIAFRERRDPARARSALEFYRLEYKKTPKDPEAAWRLAMACYFVGIRVLDSKHEKKKIYAEGRDAGLTGTQANDKCAACHFWTAINMALYGETVGVLKMLFSLSQVEDHLRKSTALDPGYAFGGAYRLLGLIEQKLPGILGGNNDEAKAFFDQAIENGPEEPLNYLFMARLLEEEFDDRKKALEYARKGLNVPPPTPDRIEAVDAMSDLRKFIEDHPAQ